MCIEEFLRKVFLILFESLSDFCPQKEILIMKRFVTIFYTLFLSSLSKVEEVILARKFKLAAKEVNKVDILKTLLQCESLWHLDFMCVMKLC